MAPLTRSGWLALGLFAVSLVLLAGRLVLVPAFGVPLNYLIVFVVTAVSGLVAVYAVAFQRERSVSVIATLVIGLVAAAVLLAESIGGGGGASPVMLDESDNGNTVTVASGQQVTLQLPGNPTTGYGWQATVGNTAVLSEQGPPAFTPSSDALGAGGTYTFKYRANTAGQTDLTLVYQRSWETVPPLKTYKLTVVVQ